MSSTRRYILVSFGLSLFAVVVVQNAWVSDDAYITFRTVDNFLHGYGLRWNVAERVQSYTHPLWMLLLAGGAFVTRADIATLSIALALLCSVGAIVIYGLGIARATPAALLGITILSVSYAFTDYSTAGLENPLTHLLLALFFLVALRFPATPRTSLTLALLAALATLNRMDTLLLFLPTLAYGFWQQRRPQTLLLMLAGFLPFVLWELFSLLYYGFPFPNTAYAKLNTGLPSDELAHQGLYYLVDSLSRDPVTLFSMAAALVTIAAVRSRPHMPIALGMVLYLLYVVKIGGDFMSGRFLAAPLFCAVVVLASYPFEEQDAGWMLPFFTVFVLQFSIPPYLPHIHDDSYKGVVNEQDYYYKATGLLRTNRQTTRPNHEWVMFAMRDRAIGKALVEQDFVGLYGYYAGPGIYIVDRLALNDALLARLPAQWHPVWRIGHFKRSIPSGYLDTLRGGDNRIRDEELAAYYDKLTLLTRGDLFAPGRLREIWRFNTGAYAHLITPDRYRYPDLAHETLDAINQRENPLPIPHGVQVDLGPITHTARLELDLGRDTAHELTYLRDGGAVARQRIREKPHAINATTPYPVEVPAAAARRGYDTIRILPFSSRGAAIGSLYPRASDSAPANTGYVGAGWYPPEGGVRWAKSPSYLVIYAARPQQATLRITPGRTASGSGGTLRVTLNNDPTRTMAITDGVSFALPLSLVAGRNTLHLSLAEGNVSRDGKSISFSVDSMNLQFAGK